MASTDERLAVLENDVKHLGREMGEVKSTVGKIDSKLDRFAETKADCSDVEALQAKGDEHGKAIERLVGALVLLSAAVPVLVTIGIFIADHFFRK